MRRCSGGVLGAGGPPVAVFSSTLAMRHGQHRGGCYIVAHGQASPQPRSTRGAGPGGPISRGLFGAGAGLGGGYSGHSGRVGLAVRMTARGAPTHAVMLAGMVARYTRSLTAAAAARYL